MVEMRIFVFGTVSSDLASLKVVPDERSPQNRHVTSLGFFRRSYVSFHNCFY